MTETIDRYAIEEELGAGGYGRVYRARHLHMGREVALKVLLVASEKERFFREAEILSRLDHPNIVRVHDCGTTDEGQAFLALELLEGETLAERMRRTGAQPISEALWIADGVLQGLSAAHAVGVIHRDLKHPNIFLAHTEEGPVVKLLDFGIAKDVGAVALTAPGMLMGTPRYMAPEQIHTGRADARSDVWSAAIVLYEMLTGSLAYGGAPNEALIAIASGPPAKIQTRAPQLPRALCAAIDSALAHDPADRFASADAFRAALRLASKRRTIPGVVSREFATGVLDGFAEILPTAATSPSRAAPAAQKPAPNPRAACALEPTAHSSPDAAAAAAIPTVVEAQPQRTPRSFVTALALIAVLAGGAWWSMTRDRTPEPVRGRSSLATPRPHPDISFGGRTPPPRDEGTATPPAAPEPAPTADPRGRELLGLDRPVARHASERGPAARSALEPPMPSATPMRPATVEEMLDGRDDQALQEQAAAALRLAQQLRGSASGAPPEVRSQVERELYEATAPPTLDPTQYGEVAIVCDSVGFAPGVTAAHTGQIERALASPLRGCDRRGELQFTFVMGALRSVTRGSPCLTSFAQRVVPSRIDGLNNGAIRCSFR